MFKPSTNDMKKHILVLFLLVCNYSYGQSLHHSMLSAQGNSQTIKGGLVVLQTIGQQSVNGNATSSNLTLQQGFQQSLVAKFFPIYSVNTMVTTVYPNPFAGIINVSFSQSIPGDMSIALYNMFGVLIHQQQKQNPPLSLSFNFEHLPSGSYILHLTAKNYAYSKTLIKQ
jgi:hypothetical protein